MEGENMIITLAEFSYAHQIFDRLAVSAFLSFQAQ